MCGLPALCSQAVAATITRSGPIEEMTQCYDAKVGKEAHDWEITGTSHTLRTIVKARTFVTGVSLI
jgi:hypothetical protein